MANLTSIFDSLSMEDICNKDTVPSMRRFKHPNSPKTSLFNGPFIQISSIPRKSMAFSLVELLMALLVASLLMAALAPVMTRKTKETVNVNGVGVNRASNFKIFQAEDCEIKADNTAICSFTVPEGVSKLDIYLQGGGGGGAGATAGINEECKLNSINGNISNNKNVCKMTALNKNVGDGESYSSWNRVTSTRRIMNAEIVPGMKNFSALLIGPGGGGGGAVGRTDCYNDAYKYLTAAQNGGAAGCATKYNVGDTYLGGPSAHVSGNTVVPANTNCTTGACCWQGNGGANTATSAYCKDTYGTSGSANYISYSGCKRTACTWQAAYNACSQYTGGNLAKGQWHLPTLAQMQAWTNNASAINFDKGFDGLMICNDGTSQTGTVNCENASGECSGTGPDISCHSYDIWTSTETSTGSQEYFNGWFASPSASIQGHPKNRAFGARCVSTNSSLYGWKSYSGGGGASGAVAQVNSSSTFMNNYIKNNVGKSFHFYARNVNEGAAAPALSATTSNNGEYSIGIDGAGIHTHNTPGYATTVFSSVINVAGGGGGYGGKLFKQGDAGKQNTTACSTGLSWTKGTDYTCILGNTGAAGTISQGGNGGSITYTLNGTTHTCAGGGGSSSNNNQNGGTPSCYGAGGGGAASYSAANGKGGNGGDSYFEASYKVERQGASGGGGGGGAFVSKLAINVNTGDTINIIIGLGGKGGTGGSLDENLLKGGNGSATKVLINGKEYIANGGEGGNFGNDDNITPIGGTGGKGGSGSPSNATVNKGKDGKDGTFKTESSTAIGGKGGNSGSGGIGSCGGLYSDSECSNPTSLNAATLSIMSDMIIANLLDALKAPAGQGGGGGAFRGIGDTGAFGNGADGTNGYVFIDWRKY